ncbi:class I SAM-dependent methyltransferase [Streptomyces sp. NBC_01537]|uniref:class I SAM-dependent methyltransferase n=1 Tax=Streptomyces sp. NBC_01537 TaxID=2903896 RepID=UPI0038685BE9
MAEDPYWNHNVAYHHVVLDAVPSFCADALDVGCGDGLLVRKLAAGRAKQVTGVDPSPRMIELARSLGAEAPNTAYAEADFLTCELPEAGYDFVCSVTAIHHMDFTAALRKMARLLRPGGRLVVISLAKNVTWTDWIVSGLGVPANHVCRMVRGEGAPDGMPVKESVMSWGQVRAAAREVLPGVRYRRHLLWRYSLVWTKPETA